MALAIPPGRQQAKTTIPSTIKRFNKIPRLQTGISACKSDNSEGSPHVT
jgi:hypothetical protein